MEESVAVVEGKWTFEYIENATCFKSPGEGGHAGKGGDPGDPITITRTLPDNRVHTEIKRFHHGPDGSKGYRGKQGKSGTNGQSGQSGQQGTDGVCGAVMYRVLDPFTKMVIEQSAKKYKLKVIDFSFVPLIDDGILEPGEQAKITNFVIKNEGGLTAPAGAEVSLTGDGFTLCNIPKFILPQPIVPGQVITITDQEFLVRVEERMNKEPRNFGSFAANVRLNTPTKYYDKKHAKGCEKNFTARLPLAIEYANCTKAMDKLQRGLMKVGVKNLATLPYGSMSQSMVCQVGLKIDFDPRMVVFPELIPNATMVEPTSLYIEIPNLMALSCLEHNIEFAFTDRVNYFDTLYYSISLIYKGEQIEKHLMDVRMAPSYMPSPQGENTYDVIFFTNSHINNVEFMNYMRIFDGLALRVNFWDIQINQGLSFFNNDGRTRHPITWTNDNQGKVIVYPMANDMEYQLMFSHDIVNIVKPNPENKLLEGGIILVGNVTNQQFIAHLRTASTEVKIPDDSISDSYVISKPVRDHLTQKSNEYIKKVAVTKPAQNLVLGRTVFNPKKIGSFKTLLGEAYYLEFGLLANANCYAINSNSANFLSQQRSATLSTLSGVGQMTMSILLALPLPKLLYILRNPTEWLKTTRFYNEYKSTEQGYYELIACALYCKIYHSIILNSKLEENLNYILQEFEKQTSNYEKNPEKIAICEALLLAFHHLGSQIKWKVSLFKSLPQKDSFDKFMESFSQVLSKIIGDPNHVKNLKKNLPTMIKDLGRENYLHILASIHRLVYDQYHKAIEDEIRLKEKTGLFASVSTDSPVNYLD